MTVKNPYEMTEKQIEALASERTQGLVATDALDGTYLRVLVNACQEKLGVKRGRRPNTSTQLATLATVAVSYYEAVMRGVTSPDIAPDASLEPAEATRRMRERNRRGTFARTAKSTLVGWIGEGGDLRAINVDTVTKTELRASTLVARENRAPTGSKLERAQQAILDAVAKETPEDAREHLQSVIEAMQGALDALDGDGKQESTAIRPRPHAVYREPVRQAA